jgi:D-galactose 1-dehydrogenase
MAGAAKVKVALVGIGKIARDQHIPAISASPDWELAATVSRNAGVDGVDRYATVEEMLAARPDIPVVSLAIPPQPRFPYAAACIAAGRHVMLEKPPGQSLAECHDLERMAREKGVTIMATWHSRHAHGVQAAKAWLAGRALKSMKVTWKEDVRRWHPGQDWVWEPGGLGVFDPGINALSIVTAILPRPMHLKAAVLDFPANRDTPVAARLDFAYPGAEVTADFDWLQTGPQTWDIDVVCADGTMKLSSGGAKLAIDGKAVGEGPDREYPELYARMAKLVRTGASDVDLAPMVHVADSFTLGKRRQVAAFDW